MERMQQKPAATLMPIDGYPVNRKMFNRTEPQLGKGARAAMAEREYSIPRNGRAAVINRPSIAKAVSVKEYFRTVAESLCKRHPSISIDPGIFGGAPHIQGVRLSVGDVLSKLYIYGSIKAVLDIYSPDVNEEQIKEAIAYAQDFLETAYDPRQPR
jgi:uncharacterized protein (DUF433 family)